MADVTSNPTISLAPNPGTVDVIYLADGRAIFLCLGSPQTVIVANGGSIAIDATNKIIYLKTTDGGNTGWLAVATLTANGVANTIAIFSAANSLTNSIMTQPGGSTTEVDINSTSQIATLKLVGTDRNATISNAAGGIGIKTERLDIARDGSGNGNGALQFRNTANNAQFGEIGFDSANNITIQPTTTGLAVIRNGVSGANLIIGASNTIGASGVSVLGLFTGTTPTNFPADTIQFYSRDATAGDNQLIVANEQGRKSRLTGAIAKITSNFAVTSNTTVAQIPMDYTINLETNESYQFEIQIPTTSNVAGGVKVDMGGSAGTSGFECDTLIIDAGVTTQSRQAAFGTTAGVTAVTNAVIRMTGMVFCNAAGTMFPRFAQNASNGAASTALVGGYLKIWQ